MEAGISLLSRLLSEGDDARCDDDGPENCRAEPLRLDALDGPCRLLCEEEVKALRCGLKRDHIPCRRPSRFQRRGVE